MEPPAWGAPQAPAQQQKRQKASFEFPVKERSRRAVEAKDEERQMAPA